jgi:hypothetical protein
MIVVIQRRGIQHRKQSGMQNRDKGRLERKEKIVQTSRLGTLIISYQRRQDGSDPVMAGL